MSSVGRAIGLDVHLEFCEVAVCEERPGPVRLAGGGQARSRSACWRRSLLPADRVAWR